MSDDGGRESAIQPEFVRVWESTMGHPPSCSPLLIHTGILEAPIRTCIVFLDRVQHLMIRAVRANFIISYCYGFSKILIWVHRFVIRS